MKSAYVLFLLAGLAVSDYAPFDISWMYTKQPNGATDGETNFYLIEFNVSSTLGDSPVSAYCWDSWGDDESAFCDPCVPWSTNVPTGEWIDCAWNSSDISDKTSGFAFQLYPYFSIGNFSMALRQNFTETTDGVASQSIAMTDPYEVTNSSSTFSCDMNPEEVAEIYIHASGECTTPSNSSGFSIPMANVTAACSHAELVTLSFPVLETTDVGECVWVVGNITELGNWDPECAIPLSTDQYSTTNPVWSCGHVKLPAGTAFEYKYIQTSADGTLLWECAENRVATVDAYTCGTQTVGNDPDYFRCGNH